MSSDSGSATGEDACHADIASIHAAVFLPSCATGGCHETQSPAAGLDLESEDVASRLVGVAAATCEGVLVIPGEPESSIFYEKLMPAPSCGTQMPPAAPLSTTSLECIRVWIAGLEQACETCGGDVCIDHENDPAHCGGCGQTCPPTASCTAGQCECPNGLVVCEQSCVNTQSNPNHCGSCNAGCDEGKVCNAGSCADGCDALDECDGACVDLDSDPEHCGACSEACGVAESCNAGTCGCLADPSSYAADVEPIFVAHCLNMGCHRPPAPSAGLDLSAGQGHGELVNVPSQQCAQRLLVSPGNPGQSYLLDKLLNQDLCSGAQMPKSAPLPAADIQAVSDWICTGAAP